MGGKTLSGRLFWLSSLWAVLSIALFAFLISSAYRGDAEQRLTELLSANLYNLMGTVEPDENGSLSGIPDLRDARYLNFQSGYYWSVHEIENEQNRLASLSLADEKITHSNPKFDENFQSNFQTIDAKGNQVFGVEAHIFLGAGDKLFSFQITANKGAIDAEVNDFVRQILLLLTLFALGFVLATYFLVRFGLSPLREISARLSDIREGKADNLKGDFPLEIQPLVDETNSMIKSNNVVIERARTQVGNLAHSLKTPLAVLQNEASNASPKVRDIIQQQTNQMSSHVQTYLDRARIAARAGSVTSRTDIYSATSRMIRVMEKLNPTLTYSVEQQDQGLIFAGEQQDLEEMLGNLLENASKFAKSEIKLSVGSLGEKRSLIVSVDDDGPGLSDVEMEHAMARGIRLDETQPGSGLGLSIVKDIAKEYEGDFNLARSKMGGLRAELWLPAVA